MGSNRYGQLAMNYDAHPAAAQLAALGSGVVQVAADTDFSAALTAGGEVYLWGRNADGQMANGECSMDSNYGDPRCRCDACLGQDVAAPARVAALGTDTVQLALGTSHALALKQGGAVFSWGSGEYGQPSTAPTLGPGCRRDIAAATCARSARAWECICVAQLVRGEVALIHLALLDLRRGSAKIQAPRSS